MKSKLYVSVYNNEKVVDYVKVLSEKFNYEIVSSGKTLEFLTDKGLLVTEIADLGLADGFYKKSFLEDFVRENIDMMIINFPPVDVIAQQTDDIKSFMQSINILDFSLLRAGAKCFEDTIVVTDVSDFYKAVNVNSYERQKLALKAFQYMSDYDGELAEKIGVYSGAEERKMLNMSKLYELKYGMNPQQNGGLYQAPEMADYKILSDNRLSYNDILNITTAVDIVSEFFDVNAAAIVKHNMPCGVALGKDIFDAYTKAFDCDPFATFSGTIAFSQTVTYELAKYLCSMSVKVIVAPYYEYDALEHLKQNPDLKIVRIKTPLKDYRTLKKEEIVMTPFGALIQDSNKSELDKDLFRVVTKVKPSKEQIEDAIFAWKIAKYARTNCAVVAKDFKTSAIMQGQTNLVSATELAMDAACENSKEAVLAVDEVIQTADCVNAAAQGRISLIIQPGGSIRDNEVIMAADKLNIPMIFTGIRNLRF